MNTSSTQGNIGLAAYGHLLIFEVLKKLHTNIFCVVVVEKPSSISKSRIYLSGW